jgi:hypothetical protein
VKWLSALHWAADTIRIPINQIFSRCEQVFVNR